MGIGIVAGCRLRAGALLLGVFLAITFVGVGPVEASPKAPFSQHTIETLFARLHRPVYAVYDVGRDPDALWDHLARSFRGEALTEQYVEHWSALETMRREATSIRVLRVDYESVRLLRWDDAAQTAELDVLWSVGGIVRHRRHRHPRTNRYRAVYELEHGVDGWRLVGTKLRDMRRIRGFTSLQGGGADGGGLPSSGAGLMSPLELLRAGMDEDVEAMRRERAASEAETPVKPSGETP